MMSLRRRKIFTKPPLRPNSDINVTPLVDVVLVLLIIFMVLTPLLDKDIPIRVPDTEKVENLTEVPLDQLVVGITPEGELLINSQKISEDEYVNRLKRMIAAKPPGEKLVFFMPDEKANYGKVVGALDGARMAGAEILGMMTELAENVPSPGTGGAPGAPGTPGAPLSPPTNPPPGTPSSTTGPSP
jgi:biopolymer transport protein TolR